MAEESSIAPQAKTAEQLRSQLSSVEVLLTVTEQHFRNSKIALDHVRDEYLSLEHAFNAESELTKYEALEPRFRIIRARFERLSQAANEKPLQ